MSQEGLRPATCDVCTAYIADVLPVPGIAPDGTAKDDRIGDLRIVCDDCAKAYEVIVRERSGVGVQPPDGTTEHDAARYRWFRRWWFDGDGMEPLIRFVTAKTDAELDAAIDANLSEAVCAEPSMSTTTDGSLSSGSGASGEGVQAPDGGTE